MWVTLIFCVFLFYFYNRRSNCHRYPPGPKPLPILGNILSVCLEMRHVSNHFKLWQLWSKKYGDILGLRMGLINVVVVSGRDLIKEVSSRDVFQGRPDGYLYTMRSFGKKLGLAFSDGAKWSKTRTFVLKCLKNFGYNTRIMEGYIEKECTAIVQLRMRDAGKPVLINTMFHVTIVNILWRLVAGKRYNLDDPRLNNLCSVIMKLFKAVDMSGGVLTFLPFLRYIAPDLTGYTKLKSIHKELHGFIEETIIEHRETIDSSRPRDVIDAFIIETSERKDDTLTQEDLQVICLDLLEAGMETVANTASFMFLHVVRNQEVQRKLHQEIDDMIGHDRYPTANDRNSYPCLAVEPDVFKAYSILTTSSLNTRMVYTEAVLLETLRISTVAAVGIPKMALEDAHLENYIIPKGTFVLLALHDLHNGSHWQDPEIFRPERFLTKEGNILQDEWLMPFGIGKRRCIGEGLARSELFMMLTHLLQKFELSIPQGDPMPSTEPVDGLSLSAQPFRIVFKPRF